MKPTELFGVAVRSLGLWTVVSSATGMILSGLTPGAILALGLNAVVGCILLFKAPVFVQAAYGGPPAETLRDLER
jgi:hypothetical protein